LKRAFCLIREAPWYRREVFASGLKRAGYTVFHGLRHDPGSGDVLLIWNRYSSNHEMALNAERRGARVLVAENGYLGAGGTSPKFDVHPGGPKPHHYYALSEGYHNGGGRDYAGPPGRFAQLGVEIKPWKTTGGRVLVCPNRSFGVPGRTMPIDWAERTRSQLLATGVKDVHIRAHPGNDSPKRPIQADLATARAVYIWSSSVGVHALLEGIPVFCAAPYWVMKAAAAKGLPDAPECPERLPHFERMAWAQWRLDEIETGEPFRLLLQ